MTNYKTLRSSSEVEEFFEDFDKERFSFDTETTAIRYDDLELVGVSFSDGEHTAYIPVGHTHKTGGYLLPEQVSVDWLMEFLSSNVFCDKKKVVAHNFVYDYKVLYKYGINLYNHEWFDTMVADHLLDENLKHGLKDIVIREFGDDYGIDVKESRFVPIEEMSEYACKDAFYTYKLAGEFHTRMVEQELDKLFFKVEMPFLRATAMMEIEGVDVDWTLVSMTTKDLEQSIIKFEEEMYECINEPYELQMNLFGSVTGIKGRFNFNSPKDLAHIITNVLNLNITRETDSGNLSVGKDTIKDLRGQHPFIEVLSKYKIAKKLLSGFFEPLPQFKQSDGKVRATFHDTGTRTGRLSSSKPNLQQLPKPKDDFPVETRACFTVPEGYKMLTCDYSSQELRVLAHITGSEKMIEAFNNGRDFHQETADAFGVDRTRAKAINFGIAYRKGAYGFAKDWGITEEEAQVYLDKYFDTFPEVKTLMEETDSYLKTNKYVRTMAGRKRRFIPNEQGYLSGKSFREAFNFLVQGFSADMIRIAAIKCLNVIKNNPRWGLKMIFTVHDEIGFKVKEEYAWQAGRAIKKAFEEAVTLKVPLVADISEGYNYAEAK